MKQTQSLKTRQCDSGMLYGKPIRVNKNLDVDASLFIRNLDPDPDTGDGKGYGFISCDNFDSSDAAIDAMNGQYLMNKPITVSYAFKKDGKGERHGSAAERLLAAQAKKIKNLCLQMSIFIRYVVYQENRFGWELRFGGSLEFFSASVVFFCWKLKNRIDWYSETIFNVRSFHDADHMIAILRTEL
ncbi:unnamed protein product [Rhizophagus irregularis]|nr:unnamed protein product [Rhizophagus irregularis]